MDVDVFPKMEERQWEHCCARFKARWPFSIFPSPFSIRIYFTRIALKSIYLVNDKSITNESIECAPISGSEAGRGSRGYAKYIFYQFSHFPEADLMFALRPHSLKANKFVYSFADGGRVRELRLCDFYEMEIEQRMSEWMNECARRKWKWIWNSHSRCARVHRKF